MGVEQDYERIFAGEPHWRDAYNCLKQGGDTIYLASAIDKGLSGDYRRGEMKGLRVLCEALDAICKTIHGNLFAKEVDIDSYNTILKNAYVNACNQNPENKKILMDFKKTAIRKIQDAVKNEEYISPFDFINSVLIDVLKNYAASRLEPAIAIASRRQKMAPYAVETRMLMAIGTVETAKFVRKIFEGIEFGPNAIRASTYQRQTVTVDELADMSLLRKK